MENHNKEYIENFNTKYNTLKSEIHSSLEDFYRTYPYYKVYKQSQRYKTEMNNINSNMERLNTDIFSLKNDIETQLISINDIIKNLNTKIKKEEKINKKLKNKSDNLEEGALSAEQLFRDEKTTYQTNIVNIIIYMIAYGYIGTSIYKLIKK